MTKQANHRTCTKCLMDTTDKDISFDKLGVCNHCHRYDQQLEKRVNQGEGSKRILDDLIRNIKKAGTGKDYDCIIGVSGGVDSTYVAFIAKQYGLRPLAIHFDNGWNSELAVTNIEKVLEKLDIDLYTYVINWPMFRDLQLSFLKASTPDGEIPTDHAINALLFREAKKRKIKYILNGMNFATESMSVKSWAYGHSDWKYIRSIHKIYGNRKLTGYPKYSFIDLIWWTFINRIRVVSILNYIDYQKERVMDILQNELGWVYYGGKHYESVYTRYYQGFILPQKFNIDKRKAHLSDLIRSGQISRDKAIEEIEKPIYDEKLLMQDSTYVVKKLGVSREEFDELMNKNVKSFNDYPNNYRKVMYLKRFVNWLRLKKLYSK